MNAKYELSKTRRKALQSEHLLSMDNYMPNCKVASQHILHQIKPLIVSAHVPHSVGILSLFSLHDNTVNLINRDKQLITLHRYGSGFSPMGWVLKSYHFDYIKKRLREGSIRLESLANGNILIGHIELIYNTHHCVLELKPSKQTKLNKVYVAQLFQQIDSTTGMFGELRKNITKESAPQLNLLCEQINCLMNGNPANITPFIGLGPGLTPSFDDIIVGIIAILSSDLRFISQIAQLQKTILALSLDSLTTTISASFLNYALQRKFSLQILKVIVALTQHKRYHESISNLLNYGHTSGTDLLLGIWLGIDRFIIKD